LGIVVPQSAFAEAAKNNTQHAAVPTVIDVALQQGGTFQGQVLDSQGLPLANTKVSLVQNEVEVASTVTDADGRFSASGLRGGIFVVIAGQGAGVYRLWAANTAPPTAQASALVVSNGEIVRGEDGSIVYWLTNPWVLAAIVATAIALPIALSNHGSSS